MQHLITPELELLESARCSCGAHLARPTGTNDRYNCSTFYTGEVRPITAPIKTHTMNVEYPPTPNDSEVKVDEWELGKACGLTPEECESCQ